MRYLELGDIVKAKHFHGDDGKVISVDIFSNEVTIVWGENGLFPTEQRYPFEYCTDANFDIINTKKIENTTRCTCGVDFIRDGGIHSDYCEKKGQIKPEG